MEPIRIRMAEFSARFEGRVLPHRKTAPAGAVLRLGSRRGQFCPHAAHRTETAIKSKRMLNQVKTLTDYRLDSLDGEMGRVKDFYFYDQHWTICYLVADTSNWLPGRQVLISPSALVAAIKGERHIAVNLTKKQIEASPFLSSDKPVSRRHEHDLHAHYGWSPYWVMALNTGAGDPAPDSSPEIAHNRKVSLDDRAWNPHLRSMQQVVGYHVQANDGKTGHIEDFVIDDEVWAIRYLLVDTRNWWPGKKVLVSPQWIGPVCWSESTVAVDLLRETIKTLPEYKKVSFMTRGRKEGHARHDSRPAYEVDGPSEPTTGVTETLPHSNIKHQPGKAL